MTPDAALRRLRLERAEENEPRDGTLFAVANGVIGVRGVIDELDGGGADTFLAEGYETRPISYHERFKGFADATDTRFAAPSAAGLTVILDGAPVDFAHARMERCVRTLDFDRGVHERETLWRLADGRKLEVILTRLTPFGAGALAASRARVRLVEGAGEVSIAFPLEGARSAAPDSRETDDPRISARAVHALETIGTRTGASWDGLIQKTRNSGRLVACAQACETLEAGPGEACAARYTAYEVAEAGDPEELIGAAAGRAQVARREGFAALAEGHARTLEDFWRGADIAISGDPEFERALRFNLFHLFQSTGRGEGVGTAAKGLCGEGYEGHYFWDTEAYVVPVLVFTAPELARSLLDYRYRTLDKARENARLLDHEKGALYAWRTISGRECSAHYPTGSAQYHINAAIAYAVELYTGATDDLDFLRDQGAEILFETARVWFDVGAFNPRRGGAFCITGVTGPDEYTALVDNNYYTNVMARRHFRAAVSAASRLKSEEPVAYAALAARIGLEESELENWRCAADAMYLGHDRLLGVTPQDDGFLDRPRLDFSAAGEHERPLLLHRNPMTLFRHQVCKQGDVIQAHAMSGEPVSPAQKRRDFDYYEPLTTHDSTLSASAFAIAAIQAGHEAKALDYHRLAAFVDIEDRFDNASHGPHMAALAGSWLALAFGWAGLQVTDGELHLAPQATPAGGYAFRFCWRGSVIEARVDARAVTCQLISGPAQTLIHRGRPVEVSGTLRLKHGCKPAAVIFDLDGVLTDTASAHYRAWKRLAEEEGIAFDEAANEALKGVDRMGSLDLILKSAGREAPQAEREAMAARKNGFYLEEIGRFGPGDLFDGALDLLSALSAAGARIGLASASRNAPLLLEKLGISDWFDHVADPARVARGKPAPDIFLACAEALGVSPGACVAVEDSRAGLDAILAAGMASIGIGSPQTLCGADFVAEGVHALSVDVLAGVAERHEAAEQQSLADPSSIGRNP